MRKYRLLTAAVILSMGLGRLYIPAAAEESEEKFINIDDSKEEQAEEKTEEESKETVSEANGLNHLQIPEKLQIVLDPWEMDGKGQIYSEEYTIQNKGEMPGTLVLSNIACQTGSQSGIIVKTDTEGLHDDTEKSLYMEMKVGDKDKIVLSQTATEYKTELQAGEKLSVVFSGEANENAEKSWKDEDIKVTMTYSWEPREILRETVAVQAVDNLEKEDEETLKDPEKKEESPITELKETGQGEFLLDSWEIDEDGKICSPLYRLKNTEEGVGTFALSELACKPAEQSGIGVQSEKTKLHEDDGRYVYMELIPNPDEQEEKPEEQREKYVFLPETEQEDPEVHKYAVEIKPGEEIAFRLVGELNGFKPEELKKGDIVVTALYSWETGESISE